MWTLRLKIKISEDWLSKQKKYHSLKLKFRLYYRLFDKLLNIYIQKEKEKIQI